MLEERVVKPAVDVTPAELAAIPNCYRQMPGKYLYIAKYTRDRDNTEQRIESRSREWLASTWRFMNSASEPDWRVRLGSRLP